MKLAAVIPWGRSFDEYVRMFALSARDLEGRILGCADGPASFNAEGTARGHRVMSCDPVYGFDRASIERRVRECYPAMMGQVRARADNYRWDFFRDADQLVEYRLAAMARFLEDFDAGRAAGRYVTAELPALPFADQAFDLALCSHFLFLYSGHLSAEFHRLAIREMLRVAREVRVFPLVDLDGRASAPLAATCQELAQAGFAHELVRVAYEFQRGGHTMLCVRHA